MSCSSNKLSALVLIFLFAFITNAQASCWRYGHSCWGGHGKRSGGSGVRGGKRGDVNEGGRFGGSWGGGRRGGGLPEGNTNGEPIFQLDDVVASPMLSGTGTGTGLINPEMEEPIMFSPVSSSFDSSQQQTHYDQREPFPSKLESMKSPFSTRGGSDPDLLPDKVSAYERVYESSGNGEEELSSAEFYDYSPQNDDNSEVVQQQQQQVQQKQKLPHLIIKTGETQPERRGHAKILIGFERNERGFDTGSRRGGESMESAEGMKRLAEVSTRKHPLNNLYMYKLIRLRRRK